MTTPAAPAGIHEGWKPDPYRRHELRYHDGSLWTEHVSDRGIPGIDTSPVADLPRSRPPDRTAGSQRPPQSTGSPVRVVPGTPAVGGLLDALVLVVDDASTGPVRAVHDEHDRHLATIRTGKVPVAARLLGLVTTAPRSHVASVEVVDPGGLLLLGVTRPARFLKERLVVSGRDGAPLGEIRARRLLQGLDLALEAGGAEVGRVVADTASDPLRRVLDPLGGLIARVSTTWEVPSARHHPASNTHLVLVERHLDDPLRSLVLAALLSLDVLLDPAHDLP